MRRDLPSGTVTFLFTDVEGSTRLLHELGAERYGEALAEHRRVLREVFSRHGGVEVDTQGDAFFVAFPTAPGALQAAREGTEGLASGPIRVRIGIHTGTPHLTDEGYVGVDVHRAARIAAAGHGGQSLVSGATAALVETSGLRDLGEHRLKDLSSPERLYQLGDTEFRPLKSLYRTNLPIPATPFLGRDRELEEIVALLSRHEVRLLTLAGPGGTGKTRLALQAAAASADAYPDGVYWVPLAPIRDPALVLEEAAAALGAQDGLAEHVKDKELLLLLDNFEQVVDAAAAVSELVAACARLTLLVTSRELLQVPAEQVYPVPPLAEEDGEALFLSRARAADPDFASTDVVADLCRRLDQLPLAIELAASRVRVLSPAQLLDRLSGRLDLLKAGRGVDPRQQTLRATIEWSYDLLTEPEQRLFARLAVFARGCTLEAAEEVAHGDVDSLQSLVDKSLVRHTSERFWMLETIREYASERLQESGEREELGRRHAEHFLALAEEAAPNMVWYSPEWNERLEIDHDNLRAALDWLEASGDVESALRLAGALQGFWGYGHVPEARRRLERILASGGPQTLVRAKALDALAEMAYRSDDTATAIALEEEALELFRRFGDQGSAAFVLQGLGVCYIELGEPERAVPVCQESVELYRTVGDDSHAVAATRTLAFAYDRCGDTERAIALHEANLREIRALGFTQLEAATLGSLWSIAVHQGRAEDARRFGLESLALWREIGSLDGIAQAVCHAAEHLAVLSGKAETAARLLSWFEAQEEKIGVSEPWVARTNERTLAAIHARVEEAAFAEAWARGRALTVEEAAALARMELARVDG